MTRERWSEKEIWDWYNRRPWLRGCNFLPSNAVNYIDMWQTLHKEEILRCADKELELAAKTGFNTLRLILNFTVWREERDGFFEMTDAWLALCQAHGIQVMFTLGNDCLVPKNQQYQEPHVGEQHYDWGYHGGRKNSPHQSHGEMGFSPLDEPETAALQYEWVRQVITRYREDPRVCVWDLYNEPGNSKRDGVTLPHLKRFFEIAREADPCQPLTAAAWRDWTIGTPELSQVERYALEHSDLVSYHCYGGLEAQVRAISHLKEYGRPILNTEWLCRCTGCTIEQLFPLFCLEKVGCYNWGFVAGLYQTYEPHNAVWEAYEKGQMRDFDFRLWFHDLYRPSLKPYNPKETELIRRMCDLSDRLFYKKHPETP